MIGPAASQGLAATRAGSSRRWGVPALAVALCLVVSAAAHAYTLAHPPCCDAVTYLDGARELRANGLLGERSNLSLRTYGFPLFVRYAAGWAPVSEQGTVLAAVHVLLFLAAATFLATGARRLGPQAPTFVWLGVVANPFLAAYLPLSLTEPLTLVLLMALLGLALRGDPGSQRRTAAIAGAGSFLAAYAVMVRPASVAIALAWGCYVLFSVGAALRRSGRPLRGRLAAGGLALLLACAAAAVPLAPQVVINDRHFQKRTAFPAEDLGRFQAEVGVLYAKYATNLDEGPKQLVYSNPFAAGTGLDPQAPLRWYLRYPARGLATAVLHVFNSLHHDYPFPYVHDLAPAYQPALVVLSQLVVWASVLGGIACLLVWWRSARPAWSVGVALFAALVVGLVLGVNAIAAVEARFGLPVLLVLGPCAAWGVSRWTRLGRSAKLSWLGAVLAAVVAGSALSEWVSRQAPLVVAARARASEQVR